MGKIRHERQKFHITTKPSDTPAESNEVPKYKSLPVKFEPTENIFAGININLAKVAKLPVDDVALKVESKQQPTKETNKTETKAKDVVDGKKPAQPEKHLTKKEKLKLKHEKLLAKIDVVQQAKKRIKEKLQKKRNKDENIIPLKLLTQEAIKASGSSTSVADGKKKFSDLNIMKQALLSLDDSLPSLAPVIQYKSKDAKTGLETKGSTKNNKQKSRTGSKGVQKNENKKKNPSKDFVKNYEYFQKLVADKVYKENPRAVIALHIKNKLRAQK